MHFIVEKKFKLLIPPHKVFVSGFPSVDGNGILLSAIIKKIEKWLSFCKYALHCTEKIQISTPNPSQSFGLWFSECVQKWNISIMEKSKNDCYFINMHCTEQIQITDP